MNDLPEVVAYQDYSIDDTDTVTDTITTIANTISDTIISKDTNSNTHSRTNTNINTDTVLNTIGKTMNYLDSYSNTYSDSNDHSVSKDHNNNYDNNEKEDDEHLATIDLSWLSHHYNIIIYIMILFSFSIAFTIGYSLVGYCRRECRKVTQPYKLTLLLFIIPLFIFLISNIFLLFHWFSQSVADAFSFGTFVGIIFKLAEKPGGKELLKLTVIQVNKKKNDVWLKSADVTVGEARRVIATALDIIPYNRIFIESGKGNFLEDNNLILINELDDSLLRTDFFGFVTTSCFVHIKEEDPKARVTFQEDNEKLNNAHKSPKHNQLKALLKGEARYGDPLGISAKVPNSNNTQDSDYFGISLVDKFAASAPISLQHPTTVIKFISWSAAAAAFGATPDNMSEIGEVSSVSSATVTPTKWSLFSRKKSSNDMYSGKPIRNGDSVVIESGGK